MKQEKHNRKPDNAKKKNNKVKKKHKKIRKEKTESKCMETLKENIAESKTEKWKNITETNLKTAGKCNKIYR